MVIGAWPGKLAPVSRRLLLVTLKLLRKRVSLRLWRFGDAEARKVGGEVGRLALERRLLLLGMVRLVLSLTFVVVVLLLLVMGMTAASSLSVVVRAVAPLTEVAVVRVSQASTVMSAWFAASAASIVTSATRAFR
jgi:Fe2+ transport system protein FeoA